MTRVIAVANQKGGVGKTTSSVSLGAELALMGHKVLVIDFDPQANATSGLGVELPEEGRDLYDVFFSRVTLGEIIQDCGVKNLRVAPSSKDLVGLEIELGKTPGRELILKSQIKLLKERFDFIFIDCPPSSGLLTLNALGAANYILIPLQAEYYALEGLSALMNTIEFVNQTFNPKLEVLGVFLTMFDARTNLSSQVEQEVRNYFADRTFQTRIPRNIRLSECPSHSLPICLYDPESAGAKAYHELALEVRDRMLGTSGEKLVANS
ncbi:MAG: ParA family protein [Bdellovibrionales bacterium]|nr:ParA family protein [Bdellovibrionales bacterium]